MKLKKTMGLLFALMATVVVTVSVLALPVDAVENSGMCGENLYWTMDTATGTLTIEGSGDMESYSSEGKVPWNSLKGSIKRIVIEQNVTGLGDYAFYNCKALTEIDFRATAMKDLAENNHVFQFAGSNGSGMTMTVGANVTRIPGYLFNVATYGNYPKIKSVVFQSGSVCETIGNKAFYYCNTLTEVNLPDSLKRIGDYAFNLTSITELTLGNRLTEIGKFAFDGTQITELTIPDSVSTIGEYAFNGCRNLQSLDLGGGVKTIGANAFEYCVLLTTLTIPDCVTTIEEHAFNDCDGLTDIKLGKGLATIGQSAFQSCNGLTAIELPASLTEIGARAFYGCDGLEQMTIPDNVTEIGSEAFYNCTGLKQLTIGKGVQYINGSAFENCTALTEIYFNATALRDYMGTTNETFAYAGTEGEGITFFVGANVTRIPESLFCPDLYPSSKEMFPKIVSVIFEQGSVCKEIATYAFAWCPHLTEITLPDSLEIIGDDAFVQTPITSIVIPDSVKRIGSSAFSGCKSLKSVWIGNGVTKLDSFVFRGCSQLSELSLGNAIKEIEQEAFSGCQSLVSLRIPDSVEKLGSLVFQNCKGLETVYVSSPQIAAMLNHEAGCGCLILYAKTILIESSIDGVTEFVTTNYPYVYSVESDGARFTAYSKNPLTEEHDHTFLETWLKDAEGHWHPCMSCDQKADVVAHVYDDDCNDQCATCGYTRTAPHSYDHACDTDCNNCDLTRVTSHTYDNTCDAECNVCGETRTITHTYDHACDADCNICGSTRSISHSFATQWSHDDGEHWHQCIVCKEKTDVAAHTWDNVAVTKEATVTEEGERTYTCLCGTTRTESIPKLIADAEDDSASEGDSDTPTAGWIVPVAVIAAVCAAAIVIVLILVKRRSK